jgi:hypothetical protein
MQSNCDVDPDLLETVADPDSEHNFKKQFSNRYR